MVKFPLTLAVITRNEAAVIGRCLDSVPFAAEKLVVDSGSEDDTVAIARAHGARVIHQDWPGFGSQRRFASVQAVHDWILVLDADEWLSPALASELECHLPALMSSQVPAAILRRRICYMGRPLRWYRPGVGEKKARLYHRDRAHWSNVRVHESLCYRGKAFLFNMPFEHASNPTLVHKQLKVLRYAELKCLDWLDRGRPARMWLAPWIYPLTFLKDYLLRLACLDGWRGFMIAHTAASYALYKRIRYYEMTRHPASVNMASDALKRHHIIP